MLMLLMMTLTLMQGHHGSAKANIQCFIHYFQYLSKQQTLKLATTVGLFVLSDLDFSYLYIWNDQLVVYIALGGLTLFELTDRVSPKKGAKLYPSNG